jgi:hypothetical protein
MHRTTQEAMTREQNHLIKKLKSLSPDEIASVQQFLEQMKSPETGVAPLVADGASTAAAGSPPGSTHPEAARDAANGVPANPDAEVARAAGDGWRRRPFQAIDADDLQPIAALFREAVEFRAASRFRYGSR